MWGCGGVVCEYDVLIRQTGLAANGAMEVGFQTIWRRSMVRSKVVSNNNEVPRYIVIAARVSTPRPNLVAR